MTGFNEAMAENAFRWLDDEVNFTKRDRMREIIAGLIGSPSGRLDPGDMIRRIVEVVPAPEGAFRNIHPPFVEAALKAHQTEMFERRI